MGSNLANILALASLVPASLALASLALASLALASLVLASLVQASLVQASSVLASLVLASSFPTSFESECCQWPRRLRNLFRKRRKTPTACNLMHLMLYQERHQNCQMILVTDRLLTGPSLLT